MILSHLILFTTNDPLSVCENGPYSIYDDHLLIYILSTFSPLYGPYALSLSPLIPLNSQSLCILSFCFSHLVENLCFISLKFFENTISNTLNLPRLSTRFTRNPNIELFRPLFECICLF
jgi:hypothetical protein